MEREYHYKRMYITQSNEEKEYDQKVLYDAKDTELHQYIKDITKTAQKKVNELKRLETLVKAVLQYRGYNKLNQMRRFYRLDKADEITQDEKSLVTKIMGRQKIIADDLVSLLKFILQLYDSHDAEIKEMTKEIQELEKK